MSGERRAHWRVGSPPGPRGRAPTAEPCAGAPSRWASPRRLHTRLWRAGGLGVHGVDWRRSPMSEQTPALPDTATWCAAARQWFDSHFERRVAGDENDHGRAVFHDLDESAERAMLDAIRAYRRKRHDAGYGALTLPREHGGAGLPTLYA